MLHQPGAAVRALQPVAAGAAQGQRRIAAAVEEQQRLLLALEGRLHRFAQRRRQPGLPRRRLAPQIDQPHLRQLRDAVAVRQMQEAVAPGLHVVHGLQRRRRGGEDHRDLRQMPAHHRHVARLIDDAILLLEGLLMLLIDDDEAEIAERQEQGRARADHHLGIAAQHRAPGEAPLQPGQFRMPLPRRARRSDRSKRSSHCVVSAISGSRTSACLPALQARRDRFEIDFGLARAGDAVEQRDAGMRLDQIVGGGALRRRRAAARACPHRLGRTAWRAAAPPRATARAPPSWRSTPPVTPAARARSPGSIEGTSESAFKHALPRRRDLRRTRGSPIA